MTVVAALVVGFVLSFAVPLQYLCGASFRHGEGHDRSCVASFREELLAFAWDHEACSPAPRESSRFWFVDTPSEGILRLGLRTTDRQAGLGRVRRVARAYLAEIAAAAVRARETPAEGERILSQQIAELETRLDRAQTQLEVSLELLSSTDPRPHRDLLLNRWRTLRSHFSAVRTEFADAYANLQRIKGEPEPTHGIVPSEMRRKALEADLSLQQDLRELKVNLAELRQHLLKVWEKAAVPLERLTGAVDELIGSLPGDDATDGLTQRNVRQLAAGVQSYRQALAGFAESWKAESIAIKGTVIDPTLGELLDTHERVRTRLNDFLFAAGKHLTAMRNAVQAIGADSGDVARYHVLQSNLMRGFRVLQSAHHHFEFAAGTIDARDNFRIDAAQRSARGLRRRTRQRILAVDERLARKAVGQAKNQRVRDVVRAEQTVERLRSVVDAVVVDLVALQEELNVNAELTEEFLRVGVQVEVTKDRREITQASLATVQEQLADLAAKRTSNVKGSELELVECRIIRGPVNLAERFRFGGVAAFVTLFTVGLGQWWINRNAGHPRDRRKLGPDDSPRSTKRP